jgi:hypothetical protein
VAEVIDSTLTGGRGRRQPCEVCVALTHLEPGRTVLLGRQRGDGRWFCPVHANAAPIPDPTRTAVGLLQRGYLQALRDAAAAAVRVSVPAEQLRKALEAVLAEAEAAVGAEA